MRFIGPTGSYVHISQSDARQNRRPNHCPGGGGKGGHGDTTTSTVGRDRIKMVRAKRQTFNRRRPPSKYSSNTPPPSRHL